MPRLALAFFITFVITSLLTVNVVVFSVAYGVLPNLLIALDLNFGTGLFTSSVHHSYQFELFPSLHSYFYTTKFYTTALTTTFLLSSTDYSSDFLLLTCHCLLVCASCSCFINLEFDFWIWASHFRFLLIPTFSLQLLIFASCFSGSLACSSMCSWTFSDSDSCR